MKQDAEAHAAEDQKRRELVELKNQADQLAFATEKTLKEHGEKVPAEDRGDIESAVSNLRDTIKGDDAEAIKRAMENLEQASHKLAEIMYEQAKAPEDTEGGPAAGEGGGDEGGAGDDVIDAEYEVKQ
jgi:molecular chaperone DnaK